jgi:hypothetical protein
VENFYQKEEENRTEKGKEIETPNLDSKNNSYSRRILHKRNTIKNNWLPEVENTKKQNP